MNDGTVVAEILIGMDYFNAVMKVKNLLLVFHQSSSRLRQPSSVLSYQESYQTYQNSEIDNLCSRLVYSCSVLDSNKKDMDETYLWKLNTIGIEDMTTDEEINNQIVSDFYSSVQIENGEIFVRFPWKPNKNCLASNHNLA
ncbi:hypothetical protein GCK32_013342 [Trichostrongylus colubriformis]|uniref:Uncharacterized protein n=1 Tax=Trichostrongylus colubriformis TaxID=6319 RepID=A0AAN8FE09_TRICO